MSPARLSPSSFQGNGCAANKPNVGRLRLLIPHLFLSYKIIVIPPLVDTFYLHF